MRIQYFRIAHITIALSHPEKPYKIFLPSQFEDFRADGPTEEVIKWNIIPALSLPAVNTCKELFTTFPSGPWAIYRCADESYRLIFQSLPREKEPHKVVFADKNFNEFQIHCKPTPENQLTPFEHPMDEVLLAGYLNLNRAGIILHAAAICFNQRGYLFCGTSGAGKSTLASLFRHQGIGVITDERVIIRSMDNHLRVFGTPWHGTAMTYQNTDVALEKVFFIQHGRTNRITALTKQEVVTHLLVRTFPAFWDREAMQFVLDFSIKIALDIECYKFQFRPDSSAVEYISALL